MLGQNGAWMEGKNAFKVLGKNGVVIKEFGNGLAVGAGSEETAMKFRISVRGTLNELLLRQAVGKRVHVAPSLVGRQVDLTVETTSHPESESRLFTSPSCSCR